MKASIFHTNTQFFVEVESAMEVNRAKLALKLNYKLCFSWVQRKNPFFKDEEKIALWVKSVQPNLKLGSVDKL